MDLFDFQGQAFRAKLRAELVRWREEGLISAQTADLLAARYAGEESGARTTAAAVYILGAMLIGGGVISLVAWNWHALSTGIRLLLAVGVTITAQFAAQRFLLRDRRGLSDALLLLGTLLFGAALFVIARHFRQSIDWPSSLLLWIAGGAIATGLYRSAPTAVLTLLLSVMWAGVEASRAASWLPLLPLAQIVAAAPLAIRSRSGPLLLAGMIAVGFTIGIAAVPGDQNPGAVCAAILAWAMLLLALSLARPREEIVSRTAGAGAMLVAGIPIYSASFHEFGRELSLWRKDGDVLPLHWLLTAIPCLVGAAILLVRARGRRLERPASLVALLGALLVLATLFLPRNDYAVPVAANLALAATAASGIASSVRQLRRGPFWLGTLMLGILIVTRFFEYQGNLLGKAAAFIVCGVVALLAGNAFERRVAARDDAARTSRRAP